MDATPEAIQAKDGTERMMEKGTIYIMDPETGAYKEFGGIKEVSITPDEEDENVLINFSSEPITLHFELTRKSKRFWLRKVFCVPKYRITEELFPRKKKRGTMRRARNKRKGHNK